MVPECFKIPYIGLHLACDDSSSTGLYINDLEGMTFKLIAGQSKDYYQKGEDFFRVKEKMAIIDTIRDFNMLVQQELTFKDVISETFIGGNWGDYEAVDKFGFEIETCNDPLIKVEIPYFTIYPETENIITVNVDVDGEIVQRTGHTTKPGTVNKIFINFSGSGNKIRVYTNLCGERVRRLTSCNCSCTHSCSTCGYLRPITKPEDYEYMNHYLTQAQIVFRSDIDSLACMYRNKLALPILYHTGIKLLREVLMTDNVSPYIDNKKESAKELLNYWEGVPEDGKVFDQKSEYYKALMPVVMMAKNYLKTTKTFNLVCRGYNVQTHCLN